jgi:hypothetical protein
VNQESLAFSDGSVNNPQPLKLTLSGWVELNRR